MIAQSFPESVRDWVALRTSARWEKQVAALVASAAVPVFLPLVNKLTRSAGQLRSADVPLFPGYVFAGVDFVGNKAVPQACRNKVAQVLRPTLPESLYAELCAVGSLLRDRELIQERFVGRPGDRVRIVGGSMSGFPGKIIRLKPNRFHVVVEVTMIGAKLEVEIDESLLTRESA